MERFRCRRCGRDVAIETTHCPECGAALERVFTERSGESFEDLVSRLVREHRDFRARIAEVDAELARGNRAAALSRLRDFARSLDRHIVDEEARILRVLIETYGRQGAEDAIKTMQQHRRVHELLTSLVASISNPGPTSLDATSGLFGVLGPHMEAEETRVFPVALRAERSARAGSHAPH